jgi:hypothetical protein
MDRNFAQLVASISSAFGPYNDTINNSAREEAKRLIILEFTAWILYLIFLKNKLRKKNKKLYSLVYSILFYFLFFLFFLFFFFG